MGRKAVDNAAAIRQRLEQYVEAALGGSWDKLTTAFGIGRTTVRGWKPGQHSGGSSVPDLPSLLVLARRGQLSLDWLLLGTGGMWRTYTAPGDSLREQMREQLITELAASRGMDRARVHSNTPGAPLLWLDVKRNVGAMVDKVERDRREYENRRQLYRGLLQAHSLSPDTERRVVSIITEIDQQERKELGNLDLPYLKGTAGTRSKEAAAARSHTRRQKGT